MWYIIDMNYLLSIDANYDSEFEAEFYFNKIKQIYINKNLQISKYVLNSTLNLEEILNNLNQINDLLNQKDQFIFISGGIAEPIVKDLINTRQIHTVFDSYSDISRVYRSMRNKCKMVNILLVDKGEDAESYQGFNKIDSMNISLGFDFKSIQSSNNKTFMDKYSEMLYILKEEGWEVPPLEDFSV